MIDHNNIWRDTLKDVIKPILKNNGFKCRGKNFYKRVGEFYVTMDYQVTPLPWSKRYTMNLGVFYPKVMDIYHGEGNYTQTPNPLLGMQPNFRVNNLTGSLLWLEVDENTNKKKFQDIIQKIILDYILPYFDQFTDDESILKVIKDLPWLNVNQYAILQILNGDMSGIDTLRNQYISAQRRNSIQWSEQLEDIAERLGIKYGLNSME